MKSREKMGNPSYREMPPKFKEFGLRLDLAIAKSEIGTAYQLSRQCGIDLSSIKDYIEGRSMPAADKLLKISKALGVSIEYLLTGQEPPLREVVIETEGKAAPYASIPLAHAAGAGPFRMELLEDEDPVIVSRRILKRAGVSEKNVGAFRIEGDSMEPILHRGDLVLCSTAGEPLEKLDKKRMYCIYDPVGGGITVKRAYYSGGVLALVPVNQGSDMTIMKIQKGEQNPIIGRVIGVWKDL